MRKRDMTKRQYEDAIRKHGFQRELFGYVKVNDNLSVFPGNVGTRLRDRLAYLIKSSMRGNKP